MARLVTNVMDDMLADGFTRRMGQEYLDALAQEDASDLFDADYRAWAHERGFFAESAYAFGLDESNIDRYLSDYDYFRVWPLNSWQRVWINDKLTLKYMLSGTKYDKYLPEYYFYAAAEGLKPLVDAGDHEGIEGFLALLREKGEFACKPANAELAQGFHKLGYRDGTYLVDNVAATEDDVRAYVANHTNDIFIEFLHPGKGTERISPVIHTLRVLTINETGTKPNLAAAYLRFATGVNGNDAKANYFPPTKAGICSFNCSFDFATGHYGNSRLAYANHVDTDVPHPETGAVADGLWPCWDEMRAMVEGICRRLGPVEYMGFDLCVTEAGPKLIEINSHSGSKYLQLYRPFMDDELLADYFGRKLAAIDALDDAARARRNAVVR